MASFVGGIDIVNSYLSKCIKAIKTKRFFWFITNTVKYKKHIFLVRDFRIKRCLIEEQAYNKIKRKFKDVFVKKDYNLQMKYNDTIWTCWLSGLENASPIPYVCINRLKELFGDRVIVITLDNYTDYVEIPTYIVDKFAKGYISYPHFADVIRNYLLVKYGGTWIDSTVYFDSANVPDYFFNSELFMFYHGERNTCLDFLNYYISAYSNHPVLLTTMEFHEKLYKNSNHEIDYLQMCLALGIGCEIYKEAFDKMPKFSDVQVHNLVKELNTPYDPVKYRRIMDMCPVQKLSYKRNVEDTSGTFYDELIIKQYNKLKKTGLQ